jgi:hypothetical protein
VARWRRAALVVGTGAMLATITYPGSPLPPPAPVDATYEAEPVPLDPDEPGQRQVGRLVYLGGWSLRSDARWFGGLSGMAVGPERILAASDAGSLLLFDRPDRAGRGLRIAPLLQGPGPLDEKTARDLEAIAVHDGSAWISFENRNQIWRYRLSDLAAVARAGPAPMRRWPTNRGGEALVRLPDGRFLMLGETREEDGASPALLFLGDPTAPDTRIMPLRYRAPPGYRATAAATLPDRRLLLLNRGISPIGLFSAQLLVADAPRSEQGAIIEGEEVATLAAPLTRDNFEALSVTQEGGRTIVWIASDDNFMPFQRTLLMKFELILP